MQSRTKHSRTTQSRTKHSRKSGRTPLIALAAALVAAGAALAQAPQPRPPAADPSARYSAQQTLAAALEGKDERVSKLIGKTVESTNGEKLGEVEDLLATTDKDGAPTVVLSVGGTLGIGEKHYATSFRQLLVAEDGHHLILDKSKDELKAAQPFTYIPRKGKSSGLAGSTGPRTTNSVGDLLGATVVDKGNKSIGEVDDFVVSTRENELRAIIELGSGAGSAKGRRVAVPFDQLRIEESGEEAKAQPMQPRVSVNFEDTPIEALPAYEYPKHEPI
jgi:sporulation protein YlmC with PRC-barrel domain